MIKLCQQCEEHIDIYNSNYKSEEYSCKDKDCIVFFRFMSDEGGVIELKRIITRHYFHEEMIITIACNTILPFKDYESISLVDKKEDLIKALKDTIKRIEYINLLG